MTTTGKKQYIDVLTGTLNRSREKRRDTSPDFFGSLTIDMDKLPLSAAGKVEIRLAGWVRKNSKTGADFLSLSGTLDAVPDNAEQFATERQGARRDDAGDGIPF